jgi:hypothetical protein
MKYADAAMANNPMNMAASSADFEDFAADIVSEFCCP